MSVQIVFKLEPDLKDKAIKRSKADGLPLAFVMRYLLRAYVAGDVRISLRPRSKE